MKLITKELRQLLPPLYSQEHTPDPMCWAKFFTPDGQWTWYAIEFDGTDLCFGYVIGFEAELGYFRLSELMAVRGPLGLPVERDVYFEPCRLSQVKAWPLSAVSLSVSGRGAAASHPPNQGNRLWVPSESTFYETPRDNRQKLLATITIRCRLRGQL